MSTIEETDNDEAEEDAEAAESEWHAWLAGIVIVLGVALVVAPDDLVPELLVGIGPVVVVMGLLGWIIQWVYKKQR